MNRREMNKYNGSRHNAQMQRFNSNQDPFTEMKQVMRGFGGFQDQFFGSMMPFGGRDPFEEMFKFSDIHKDMHGKGKEGSFVCQTFSSSSKMGSDGKMHHEQYFENNMGEHRKGQTISQKQQAYKNNQGINRIAEERMLNDKGYKRMKQKRGNDIQETNHYYNIDEEEVQRFGHDWRRQDNEMKFLERHQKHLQSLGNGQGSRNMQIGYQPSSYNQQPKRAQRSKYQQLPSSNGSQYGGSRGSQRSKYLQPQPRQQSYQNKGSSNGGSRGSQLNSKYSKYDRR